MKIYVDEDLILEIDATMIKLLEHQIAGDLKTEVKRLLAWLIEHRCAVSFDDIKKDYIPKLMDDPMIKTLPCTKNGLIDVITKHSSYKSAKTKKEEQDRFDEARRAVAPVATSTEDEPTA